MKKIFVVAVFAVAALAQTVYAQDSAALSMQKIISDYISVKNALTKDNADSASAYAKIFLADLRNAPTKDLPADKHEIWHEYDEALIHDADEIGSNNKLKHQREHFAGLSLTFYKLVKEMEMNNIDLYYQYCPMVDTHWISEKSTIANPYMGKKMPTCGSTEETLKTK